MSKFFYKGRIEKKPKHASYGFNTKRSAKLGTEEQPLSLIVNSDEKKEEVMAILADNALVANIEVSADKEEDLVELHGLLNKPQTTTFDKTPNRNDPCSCGSGKKYKKCCA
ncbi:PBPRA1643 family SWIM/SEC-C metal-binding motif protein [Photobacterium sanguinicancri]|uniref:SEC-C metal-binding domain-containing protein n=1 Tax=Photobacterium sanguinicancri TaxID=875932 RepID=A0AAW7YEE5_9GAMM|nr:PBPRA1643 family SWIM/SEC-C metal-binding motif protein [Photobacterium sanguinicancri]KXI23483.1 zinc chelation protein SecC [Photobacterium sanguinicancri]MDO6499223.1 SEC-C metal-binding domain-containing protein [Photobacterium sanguinicancri]MDO6545387.1 SEC-C metal-binding domain-containing protein [Photobacterium sanguinicancri]OZS42848.1 zinc chelation protein SecC [Photobacterium sanguinicancri]